MANEIVAKNLFELVATINGLTDDEIDLIDTNQKAVPHWGDAPCTNWGPCNAISWDSQRMIVLSHRVDVWVSPNQARSRPVYKIVHRPSGRVASDV